MEYTQTGRWLARARRGEPLRAPGIIDMHGHLGRYCHAVPDLSAAGLVQTMDRLGVHSIMLSHIQCEAMHARRGNDELLAAMRAFPERILGYVILFPASTAEVRYEMERCLRAGFCGLKVENVNGHSYLNPAYVPAFEIAHARRLPVLLHTWGCQGREGDEVRALARRYADCAFLLAHAGAGGTEQAYIDIARQFGNVYLDLAVSVGPRGLVRRLVAGVGAERVVYGSDCYFYSMTQQIGKVLGAGLSDADTFAILHANGRRLLDRVLK